MGYDIAIWKEIRYPVEQKTRKLWQDIIAEISKDRSLREFQGIYPVPWQLREVMQQCADTWIQRLYEPCSDAYKRSGKELSAEFDRAVWAYCVEPFIMREVQANAYGYRASKLLELLLCAAGSPPEQRNLLKVGQKDCCIAVRRDKYETWYDRLHHLPSRIDEAVRTMAASRAMEARAKRVAAGLPPEPSPLPPTVPALESRVSKPPENAAAPLSPPPALHEPPMHPTLSGSEDGQPEVPRGELPVPSSGVGPATTWDTIEIWFVSDHRVQIRNGTKTESRNYSEFGFEDGRNGKPNQAWETLRALAERRGVIQEPTEVHQTWPQVEKRIQEIRKVLRKHFGICDDPISFIEGAGYRARFKIACRLSFHT